MPATSCTNPVLLDFAKDNGRVTFRVEITHDGVSVPPNCDGTVSRIVWSSTSPDVWYAHLPQTRLGPAVYRIAPGSSGSVADRPTLHAGGFDTRSDVNDYLDVSRVPPQPGERLLN